jgi:hypothetical protein
MIAALLVVGAVSHIMVRHVVQTSALWIAIVLVVRNSGLAKWAALPCFVLWLLLMAAIFHDHHCRGCVQVAAFRLSLMPEISRL